MSIRNHLAGLAACVAVAISQAANGANSQNVATSIEFVSPVTVVANSSLQFGLVDVNFSASETVTVAADDSVVDAGDNVLGGTPVAAKLTVSATAAQAVRILVDNVTGGDGYDLDAFVCSYDGGVQTPCDGHGMSVIANNSATLRVGATIVQTVAPETGTANGSFDLTVTYD